MIESVSISTACHKSILIINTGFVTKDAFDYFHDEIFYYHTTFVEEAIVLLKTKKECVDAIMVTPDVTLDEVCSLRKVTEKSYLPIFMYTHVYDESAKHKALKLGLDDYCNGVIGNAFLKSAEFIKKIKGQKDRTFFLRDYFNKLPKISRSAIRRSFDLAGALLGILICLPLFLAAIIQLKIHNESVFVKSKRVGQGYWVYDLISFATKCEKTSRFGKFLEVNGLHALPALINVIKGDMSLIGPRPLTLDEAEQLTKDQFAFRLISPVGFTGLLKTVYEESRNIS